MRIAALILGIIGGLSALALGPYGYAVSSLFGVVSGGGFGALTKAISVILPIAALLGAAVVLNYPLSGALLLIGSSIGVGAVLGFNFLSMTTVLLLAVAGVIALLTADVEDIASKLPELNTGTFWIAAAAVGIALLVLTRVFFTNEYFFFAAYVVLQYVVLSTAWNILGGYTGYINFGTGAFFAVGAYSTAVLHNLHSKPELVQGLLGITFPAVPLPVMILVGGIVSGLLGLGTGYLSLRLRGVFFAIATLALTVVVQTLIVNWDYVGGSRGIYIIRPAQGPLLLGSYIQYLYSLMIILAVIAVGIARTIERSTLGLGFAAIRDDELAAEAGGVPTLRLKLIATTLSGALMGMAGAPLPYYVTYLDPTSSFNLAYAVNSVAMPVIGGMTSWVGPIIGSVLLGTIQQLATVTISSALNLLIVGLLLIAFVIIAPNGIVGLVRARRRKRAGAAEALAARNTI